MPLRFKEIYILITYLIYCYTGYIFNLFGFYEKCNKNYLCFKLAL